MNENERNLIVDLRQSSPIAYLASIGDEGYPFMRAMLVLEHDSLETQYFSTNTSSVKVSQFMNNPKASVYYCRLETYKGVLFVGDMQVCEDQETKDFLWREGFERFYPKGATDPDYCVLKFAAKSGSLCGGSGTVQFTIDELEG